MILPPEYIARQLACQFSSIGAIVSRGTSMSGQYLKVQLSAKHAWEAQQFPEKFHDIPVFVEVLP